MIVSCCNLLRIFFFIIHLHFILPCVILFCLQWSNVIPSMLESVSLLLGFFTFILNCKLETVREGERNQDITWFEPASHEPTALSCLQHVHSSLCHSSDKTRSSLIGHTAFKNNNNKHFLHYKPMCYHKYTWLCDPFLLWITALDSLKYYSWTTSPKQCAHPIMRILQWRWNMFKSFQLQMKLINIRQTAAILIYSN